MRQALVIFLGLSVSGCATYVQTPDGTRYTSIEQVNNRVGITQPISYRVGYGDGCNSGRLSAGDSTFIFKKDTERTNVDDLYKHGWDDGFNQCKATYAYTPQVYYPVYYYWPSVHFGYGYGLGHRHRHRHGNHFSFGFNFGHGHHR